MESHRDEYEDASGIPGLRWRRRDDGDYHVYIKTDRSTMLLVGVSIFLFGALSGQLIGGEIIVLQSALDLFD